MVDKHLRQHCKFQWFIKLDHYLKTLRCKPGALSNSQALYQADHKIKELYQKHFKKLPKVFIDLIYYIKTNPVELSVVNWAIKECIKKSLNSPLSSDKIIWMIRSKTQVPDTDDTSSTSLLNQQIREQCIKQLKAIQAIF